MYNLHERIKVRAYYIHIETGKSSQECWLQAENIEKKLVKYNDGNLDTMSKLNFENEKLKKDDKEIVNWVKVVDLGTTVQSSDMQDYIEAIRSVLDAKEVRITDSFNNSNGLTVHEFDVCGDISRMAIKRMSQNVFTLKWFDDSLDQGYLQRSLIRININLFL